MWKRSMVYHLEAITKDFENHSRLRELPQYATIVKEYNSFAYEVANEEINNLQKLQNEIKVNLLCTF